MEEESKKTVKDGLIAGFLGSLCCTTPLAIVLLGLSGVSGAMALATKLQANFRWTVFVPIAVIFLAGSMYSHIKRKEGECNWELVKEYKNYILATVAFAGIVWAALLWVLVPAAFGMIG